MESSGEAYGGVSDAAPDAVQAAHCHEHVAFVAGCATCRQARANSLPYPVKKTVAPVRSYGYKDDITAATFKEPARPVRFGDAETATEFSLSLVVLRFILRLIWPFGRIL